jgi:hypothetical protein
MEEPETHLQKSLEHFLQKRQQQQAELDKTDAAIRVIREALGMPPQEQTIPEIAPDSEVQPKGDVLTIKVKPFIRPDEFFRMSQSDAAKAYLRKIGHAIPFDDLVVALQKGGAKLGGADPKKTLYVSLARNPRKEFVWPSKDVIGLDEFYRDRSEK